MDKPSDMFDRDHEWAALRRFINDPQPDATPCVVSGRRRQGKTFLLDAACRAAGGFYFGATEATHAESLRRISTALTEHTRTASPYHFVSWRLRVTTGSRDGERLKPGLRDPLAEAF